MKTIAYVRPLDQKNSVVEQLRTINEYFVNQEHITIFENKYFEILEDLPDKLDEGDTVVISTFSVLGKKAHKKLAIITAFLKRKINLLFVKEKIDCSSFFGQELIKKLETRSEKEKEKISDGIKKARRKGKAHGRPSKYPPEMRQKAIELRRLGATIKEIATILGVSEEAAQHLYSHKFKSPQKLAS
jgi:DNA invertase Pin-like site-specific DNA recombinase